MKLFGFGLGSTSEKETRTGDEYLKKGKMDLAIMAYEKALKLNPKSRELAEKLKSIYRERDTIRAMYALTVEGQEAGTASSVQKQETPSPDNELSEKRLFQRIPDQRMIAYRALQRTELHGMTSNGEGTNQDISEGGIYLVAPQKIPMGTFLELSFQVRPDDLVYAVGKVVRSTEAGNGFYGLGVRFTNISDKDRQKIIDFIYSKEG